MNDMVWSKIKNKEESVIDPRLFRNPLVQLLMFSAVYHAYLQSTD
jgi:hypothetical protein